MKPVLVLQHLVSDGPSYLADWLAERGIAMDLRCTEAGQDFPRDLGGHAALAILGGAMSANDPLPSLRRAEGLVRNLDTEIPQVLIEARMQASEVEVERIQERENVVADLDRIR